MQCSGGEQAEAVGIGLGHAQALGRAGHKDQVDVMSIRHQARQATSARPKPSRSHWQ
jgi:hypothetical protein